MENGSAARTSQDLQKKAAPHESQPQDANLLGRSSSRVVEAQNKKRERAFRYSHGLLIGLLTLLM